MKKRIFAVLASVLVLVLSLPLAVFADSCNHLNVAWYPVEGVSGKHYQYCHDCSADLTGPQSCVGHFVSLNELEHYEECIYCQNQLSEVEYHSQSTVILSPATCGGYGWKTDAYCFDCGYEGEPYQYDSEYGSHSYSNGVCIHCGYASTSCTHKVTSYVDLGNGTHSLRCSNCDYLIGSASVHVWNDGVVIKQPTPTENGIRTFTCTVCKSIKTETIDYIDFDKLLKDMTQEEATLFFKKIFAKYSADLGKDDDLLSVFARYFAEIIFPSLNKDGVRSPYYVLYGDLYTVIADECAENTIAFQLGYNEAMASVIDKNPVQGLFQGMFAGMMSFYGLLAGGISVGGVTLSAVVSTALLILIAAIVFKIIRSL